MVYETGYESKLEREQNWSAEITALSRWEFLLVPFRFMISEMGHQYL